MRKQAKPQEIPCSRVHILIFFFADALLLLRLILGAILGLKGGDSLDRAGLLAPRVPTACLENLESQVEFCYNHKTVVNVW